MMLTNSAIADLLRTYADLLELTGESSFRLNAYRRAADTIRDRESALAHERDLTAIPGIGKGIAANLRDILSSGSFAALDELQEEVPGSVLALLDVPGVGAKTAARMYRELNIASLTDLDLALRDGRISTMKGMGPKVQTRIREGLAFLQRRTGRTSIGIAWPLAQHLAARLQDLTGRPVQVAGSVRRMCITVGNIDLLVVSDNIDATLNQVTTLPDIAQVVDLNGGTATFELHQGVGLRVRVAQSAHAGSALIEMTGSAAHLRALRDASDDIPAAASEEACYAALGLPWIAPELRENRGELEAARAGELPNLIELDDLRGDLHVHSTWSDGSATPLEMAFAAGQRGYAYLAITDHSGSLGVAGGLSKERITEQRAEIHAAQAHAPVRLLTGSEIEVHRDGRLDFDDEVLARLDIVVASLHSGLRQPMDVFTARMLGAIQNPHVDIIAHPTGRLVERRQGAEIAWADVFAAASTTGTALEINSDPARLDMDDLRAREAARAGALISIDSDAHHPASLDLVRYGIGVARRAWIEASQVVNTWSLEDVLAWLNERRTPS